MAHHTYPPGTPTGVVPVNYVVPENDWAHVLAALYKSINGDEGGTWAPSGFITVGGAGFSFTGTGHQIAASARVTIQSTGEMRVANGGLIRLDGTSGDIDLKVTSNTALIDVGNGAAVRILAGGSLDIIGTMAVSAAGPGNVTWATSTTAVFNSGSTLTLAAGADMTAAGTVTLSGQIIVTSVGDITVSSGGLVLGVSGATFTWQGAVNLYALTLVGSSVWPELATARSWERHSLQIYLATFDDGQPLGSFDEFEDSWVETSDAATAPCLRTRPASASGRYTIIWFPHIPQGGTILTAVVRSKGINNTVTGYPLYTIVRWQGGESSFEDVSSATTDSHSGGGDFDATIATTTVTATALQTIDNAYQYGVKINHPYYTSLSTAVRIYDVKLTGTIDVIQSN